ncbi:MAG: T9SS type A sorting domain-containing protein, partial [Ignavibacteriaceae bacterium]|nr:T9SS type A sorting domain-containing protein [Ignavibacteriaceae bacterium]
WITGNFGLILRTRDGGLTWQEQFSQVEANSLYSVCFVDTLNGWIVGEGGTIIHTTDGGGVVNVKNEDDEFSIPKEYFLSQNYPNPFNPSTTIRWQQPETGLVTLKIYDVLGNEIVTLVNEEKSVGIYEINWNANKLSSGIYFYQLKAGSFSQTKKMILLK